MAKEKKLDTSSNSLIQRLKKNSKLSTDTLNDSQIYEDRDFIKTEMPVLNLALSGNVDRGLSAGLIMIAGPSKHFKSNIALIMAKAYLDRYEDSVILFYDSEFGITKEYIKHHGIDPNRVIHTPVTNIEELKFDLVNQLETITKLDKIFIMIDSIGNLASKKEVEDALNEKSVADMSRAKAMKSLFRILTPHLAIKNIPMVVINHSYKSLDFFSKDVVSGGTGGIYSSNTIFIVSRSQEKEGTEVNGFSFTLNVEKSRFVKEKSKLKFSVKYKDGIIHYSGLLEDALEGGYVEKPSNGWYVRTALYDDKKVREQETSKKEYWLPLFAVTDFKDYLRKKYSLSDYDTPLFIPEISDQTAQTDQTDQINQTDNNNFDNSDNSDNS